MPTQMIKSLTQLNYPGVVGQDEGLTIGTGTVLNFRGANVVLSISGSIIDIFVTGSLSAGGAADFPFGDGSDGDVTINGVVRLVSIPMYNNLTIVSGAELQSNGYPIYVAGTLLLNPYGKITANGLNGLNGTGSISGFSIAGASGAYSYSDLLGVPNSQAGGFTVETASGTLNGAGGNGTSALLNGYPYILVCGGGGGGGGSHGSVGNAGGNGSSNGATHLFPGGAGGTATGSISAALSGAAGGGPAGVLLIYANEVNNQGILEARGGHGGAGWAFTNPKTPTLQAAGGNGGGGGGGPIILYYRTLVGNGIGFLNVSGGGWGLTGSPQSVPYGWRGNGGQSGTAGIIRPQVI